MIVGRIRTTARATLLAWTGDVYDQRSILKPIVVEQMDGLLRFRGAAHFYESEPF